MVYEEKKMNLFDADFKKYKPAHCISLDCKMGAGIAVPMKKKFKLSSLEEQLEKDDKHPITVFHNDVYNLITKKKYSNKPTYESIKSTILQMKEIAVKRKDKHIIMPKIGCGLDRLSWGKVREMIKEIFDDTDIEILVCHL